MTTNLPVSYPDFVRKLFNRSGDPSKDFTHAILGIKTEIFEYLHATDRINGVEELGDLAFYVEALRQVINDYLMEQRLDIIHELDIDAELISDLATLATFEPRTAKFEELSALLNDLLDDAKRWVGYNREPDSLPAVFLNARGRDFLGSDRFAVFFFNDCSPFFYFSKIIRIHKIFGVFRLRVS